MNAVLDVIRSVVDRVLDVLPDGLVAWIGLPAFFLLVAAGLVVLVRKAVPALAGPAAAALSGFVAFVALPFMAVILVMARAWRMVRLRPPAWVYTADDALVAATGGATRVVTGVRDQARRLAKFPTILVLVFAALLLWRWDSSQCASGDPACITPVKAWVERLNGPGPTVPEPDPSLTPSPVPS